MKKNSKTKANIIMLLAIVVLVIGALLLQPKGEFEGSDGAAEEMIIEIQPDYEPWFEPLIEPKSGEIESLLFTLQGSIGAAIIAYVIGFNKGKNKNVID
ncbi:energy-coupling factor ABC transporter substrate-binding protein [Vagococcus carniphilus]|uniref:energy-coupling factor ABC transporter substrate-binding protein n=1 Tax=Vagococcus carniphilus TaxID=218144 RepID=UPI00288D9CE2|nr:energy-coupling factor ABC transporter substrate-binding protein [Vagococcus carniphilus]MDT2849781.1 energy-coupling factor ABC transporter substrate-binding protein [Vagococcus carniphilus]